MKKKNIKTKFGNASIDDKGYYRIHSNEYGFKGKLLHRLILADALGCGIPSDYVVHHIDGDKLNNEISNLEVLTRSEHNSVHGLSLESKIKISKSLSHTPNYFRVTKHKTTRCKQGFVWRYRYYEDGKYKELSSTDIKILEEKVRTKNLPWYELE